MEKRNRTEYLKQWYIKNRERQLKLRKEYYEKNKKKEIEQATEWYKKNKEKVKEQTLARYHRNKNNIQFKLSKNLRSRLTSALKGGYKSGSAVQDLGCTIEKLRKHLESMFYSHSETGKKMTWDNYGLKGWHIDHIKSLASFDLTDRNQLLEACHYTNLQPLWAEDNLSKK